MSDIGNDDEPTANVLARFRTGQYSVRTLERVGTAVKTEFVAQNARRVRVTSVRFQNHIQNGPSETAQCRVITDV